MRRRFLDNPSKKTLFTQRFFPAGEYTWTVPAGCTEVDVFLVGGGGSGADSGGGGGYTKTYKRDNTGWKDGNAIPVTPLDSISVVVGKGGDSVYSDGTHISGNNGGYSQFMSSDYRADGGSAGYYDTGYHGGNGGSGGSVNNGNGGSDGGDAYPDKDDPIQGKGQGHTTRDFGEPDGKRNAGGGSGDSSSTQCNGGESDYTEGKGDDGERNNTGGYAGLGGGGYGGGGGAYRGWEVNSGAGGDGTVLIRYYADEEGVITPVETPSQPVV